MVINDSTAFTVHKHKNFAGIVFFYFRNPKGAMKNGNIYSGLHVAIF